MHSLEEVGREADTVRSEIEQLYVRGLASSTPAERKRLSSLAAEWERLGAGHVASKVLAAVQKADSDAKDAPQALLSAYTSLHVFERVLSLEAAAEAWAQHLAALEEGGEEGEGGGEAPAEKALSAPDKAPAAPPIEDPKGALSLLDELSRAVEDLVRTGLTSATESTRAKLDASFKEASRRKFSRLGASLRFVNEEVERFLADSESFSIRRFSLFLHRSWMIARGIAKGIREQDARMLSTLVAGGTAVAPQPVPFVDVVTMGVLKRTISSIYSFEFKLRIVGAKDPKLLGRSLTYSLVFPRKKAAGKDLPAEAYLHLPQPQKFMPRILHQGKVVKVTDCAVALDDRGGRLMLGPKSTMTEGAVYTAWQPLYRFDAEAALDRVRRVTPGPLDLAVEMQEEVFVEGGAMTGDPVRISEGRRIFGLTSATGLSLDVVIPDGPDGDDLLPKLRAGLKSREKPLLYGLVYYEFGRMMCLPLSLMRVGTAAKEPEPEPKPAAKKKGAKDAPAPKPVTTGDGPDLITLSQKKFDISALVGTLSF